MQHVSSFFQVARSKVAALSASPHRWAESWRTLLPVLAYAVGFLIAESAAWLLAFALSPKIEGNAPLIVHGAVLVAALLLAPPKRWWLYLGLTALLIVVNVWLFRLPPSWSLLWVLLLLYLGIVGLAVSMVSLLRRFAGVPVRFASVHEVSRFVLCACGAAIVPACVFTAGRIVIFSWTFWFSWETAYFGTVLAILVFTPAIVLWATTDIQELRTVARRRVSEGVLLALGLLIVSAFVFGVRYHGNGQPSPLIYLVVPLLLWAAVRFGLRGITSALALTTLIAIWGATQGVGPFVGASVFANVFALQLFLIFIGVPFFFLATLTQERAGTDKALRASEARYRAVVETQTEMITRYRPDLTLTFVNEATCRFGGKSREELLGTSFLTDVPEDESARVREMIAALLAQPDLGIITMEHQTRSADGSLRWQQWVDRTIVDSTGRVIELQGIGRDITDRKRMEEDLRASEERYRAVVRNLPQTAVLLFDAQLRHTFADGPGLQALGLAPEKLEGRMASEAFPDELAAALAPRYEAARSGRAADVNVEYAERIYRVQVVPLPADATAPGAATEAAPVGMVVLRDITEQRRARDELVRERTRAAVLGALSHEFRTLPEHSPDLIARLDPLGRLVYLNSAGADLLGRPAEYWLGRTVAEVGVPQDVAARWTQRLQDVVMTRAPRTFDVEVSIAPAGQVRSLHVRFVPEVAGDTQGSALVSVLVVATDVSALKQAEARLAEQANELETIFESQADGVAVYDLQERCTRANTALRDLLGIGADSEFTARPLHERTQRLVLLDEQGQPLPPEQWPLRRVLRGEVLAGASVLEAGAQTLDGRNLWISITGAPMRAPDGQITGAVLIARDVTARRQLERQAAEQAAELEATFEAMADGVLVYGRNGCVVRANRAWQDQFRLYTTLSGLAGEPGFAALPFTEQVERWDHFGRLHHYLPRDADGHEIPMEEVPSFRALRGETVTGANAVDERFESPDGRIFEASVTAAPVRDAAGHIVGAVAVARDVTTQRQLERQVREQASQLEAIFEAITDGVGVFDLQGRYVHANMALRQLLGFDSDAHREYAALPPEERAQRLQFFDEQSQLIPLEQWPQWRVLRGEVLAGASAVEGQLLTLDGRKLWISTTGALIHTPDEQASGVVLITRDVTARRALERQAAEQAAEQAAAAERTRLAHELHDTVTQEIYSAGLLADSITRNWQEHRADAEAALAQLPGLIRGALAGLRVLLLELRPTTLDELPLAVLLRQLAEAMSTRAQVPIAVHFQLSGRTGSADMKREAAPDGTDAVPVEAVEPVLPPAVKEVFYRVAQEALMNAAKYAKARTIRVQLRTRAPGQSAGKGKGNGQDGSEIGTDTQGTGDARHTIELAIVDDGQGFDPRTVAAGHFGLAIMRERTHAVGAMVQIRSQPGQGTRIVAAWPNGNGNGNERVSQAARQVAALHQNVAPHG